MVGDNCEKLSFELEAIVERENRTMMDVVILVEKVS